jgi:hypothetical protein
MNRRPIAGAAHWLRRRRHALAAVLFLFAAPSSAFADDEASTSGRVVRIDGPEVYVDLGRRDGVAAGTDVILYRRIVAHHPETGARLEDRFELITAPITDAGTVLSRLRLPRDLAVQVNVGDEVRVAHLAVPDEPATGSIPGAIDAANRIDGARAGPDLAAFRQAFGEASGATAARRLEVWRNFVATHPDSDLVPLVTREIDAIEAAEDAALPVPPAPPARPAMALAGPTRIVEGEPLQVVATSLDDRPPARVLLHYRRPGEEAFRFRPMQPYGDGAFAGRIPETMLAPPHVEWFATAHDEAGAEHRVGGGRIQSTRVEAPPAAPNRVDRSRLKLAFQYVDFYRFRGVDAYTHVEGHFLYRTLYPLSYTDAFPQLYSVGMGFGAYQGVGGPVAAVVDAADTGVRLGLREVGFNFGYTELELRFHENVAILGRGIVGIVDDGLNFGGQTSLRVGPELGTNLVLGALSIGELGRTYLIQLAWDTVPHVPMNASVEVTTWPVSGADLGVRLLYEARYRFTPWFEMGGRVGYGLRNIHHGGLTLGLGTVFSW